LGVLAQQKKFSLYFVPLFTYDRKVIAICGSCGREGTLTNPEDFQRRLHGDEVSALAELESRTLAGQIVPGQIDAGRTMTAAPAITERIGPPPTRAAATGASELGTKMCPDCGEEVKAAARICRFCRYEFGSFGTSVSSAVIGTVVAHGPELADPAGTATHVVIAHAPEAADPADPAETAVPAAEPYGRWRIVRSFQAQLPIGSAVDLVLDERGLAFSTEGHIRLEIDYGRLAVTALRSGVLVSDVGGLSVDFIAELVTDERDLPQKLVSAVELRKPDAARA
jgi:hypothetical protein